MLTLMRKKHNQDSAQIPSPLGSFLPSSSATVLQFDNAEDATQGNSNGPWTRPKLLAVQTLSVLCVTYTFQARKVW